jgi:hypothetical protein
VKYLAQTVGVLCLAATISSTMGAPGTLRFTDVSVSSGVLAALDGMIAESTATGYANCGPHGIQWADANGDGYDDFLVTNIFQDHALYDLYLVNRLNGTFVEVAGPAGLRANASKENQIHKGTWFDMDADGDYDLFTGNTMGRRSNLYRNGGSGRFADVTDHSPALLESRNTGIRGSSAADVDGDGDLDLIAGAWSNLGEGTTDDEIYLNDGTGRFTELRVLDRSDGGNQGMQATDYDLDGDIDIYLAKRDAPNQLWQNDGKGKFEDVAPRLGLDATEKLGQDGATFADLDNDGDLDVILAGGEQVKFFRRERDGSFADLGALGVARFTGIYTAAVGDVDNDGHLDVYVPADSEVYLGDGAWRLQRTQGMMDSPPEVGDPRCAAFADYDNDGDLDFAIAQKRGKTYLYRNELNGGNWLKVRLISPQGVGGAFGAKVLVYEQGHLGESDRLLGMREANGGYAYCAQNSPVLHFGLGDETQVDVRVVFQLGGDRSLRGVPAGQTIVVDGRRR